MSWYKYYSQCVTIIKCAYTRGYKKLANECVDMYKLSYTSKKYIYKEAIAYYLDPYDVIAPICGWALLVA